MQRIAPSQRIGEELADLLTGGAPEQLSPTELRGLLVRLGMQRVLQELLEAKQRDFLGAERYQRGPQRQGQRNGYEPAHLETVEGRMELHAPQVRGSAQPFQSRLLGFLQGRTETVERLVSERYAPGLSTRDIELAFTESRPVSPLASSKPCAISQRLTATRTSSARAVPTGVNTRE